MLFHLVGGKEKVLSPVRPTNPPGRGLSPEMQVRLDGSLKKGGGMERKKTKPNKREARTGNSLGKTFIIETNVGISSTGRRKIRGFRKEMKKEKGSSHGPVDGIRGENYQHSRKKSVGGWAGTGKGHGGSTRKRLRSQIGIGKRGKRRIRIHSHEANETRARDRKIGAGKKTGNPAREESLSLPKKNKRRRGNHWEIALPPGAWTWDSNLSPCRGNHSGRKLEGMKGL